MGLERLCRLLAGCEILGVEPDSAARVAGSAPLLGSLGVRNDRPAPAGIPRSLTRFYSY